MPDKCIFHCLDILTRDQIIMREEDGTREVRFTDADEGEEFDQQQQQKTTGEYREFLIHLFGKTTEGKTIRVDVQGFRPYFYIQIPGTVEDVRKQKTRTIQHLKDYLTSYCKSIPLKFLGISYCEKQVFYGYTANRLFPFVKIDTPSLEAFRAIKNAFLNRFGEPELRLRSGLRGPWGTAAPKVYEANIDPMLRFIHERNLKPCGWMSIPSMYITTEDDQQGIVADVEWEDVLPVDVAPAPTGAFKVVSWDIETYSNTGDFTVAKKDYSRIAKNIYQRFLKSDADAAIEYLIGLYYADKPLTTRHPLPKREIVERRCRNLRDELELYLAEVAKERSGPGSAQRNEDALTNIRRLFNSSIGQTMPLAADPIIQIGTTIVTGNGQPERHIFVQPSCAPVEGATLHVSPNEKRLILDWCRWIVGINPDIMIGYNIFGFDEKYVWERAEDLGITVSDEIQGLNRLIEFGSELKLREQFLSSSALGDNMLYMWTTDGRLKIDLLHYIRRIAALPSYKLDFVTGHYMSGKIQSIEAPVDDPTRISLTVKGSVGDARVGRAIVLLDENGEPVTDKMVVLSVKGKTIELKCSGPETIVGSEERVTFLADLDDAEKWAIVKDDLPPQDIFRCHEGNDEDRARVATYCVQDCDLVMELYKKLDVFTNSMAMSNVCSVPISYIFTRGQGIKIESLMFKEAALRNQLIVVQSSPGSNFTKNPTDDEAVTKQEDSYEGAIVLDPIIGLHKTPVGVADFASLYPSTIVSENISHDTLVWVKDYSFDGRLIEVAWGSDEYDGLPGNICAYTDIEFDLLRADPNDKRKNPKKIAVGRRICRYAQPADGSKGTVPQIIQQLLAARKAKRNEAAKETDPLRSALLDTEQNAYKITANSLYGQLGSRTFKIRLQHLAASVTGYGRKQIMFAKSVIEEFYGPKANDPRCKASCEARVVYGDSVTGDTPLLVKMNNNYYVVSIEELFRVIESTKHKHHTTKEAVRCVQNVEIWTETGWTHIKLVIRHKLALTKKLYRIKTESGIIDVTEDHSLLLSNGCEISPTDVIIGTELLHSIPEYPNEVTINCITYNSKTDDYIKFLQTHTTLTGNKIVSIEELPHPGDAYVYDLETENHHFAVGPGALVVHNTDSLFITFSPRNPETGEPLEGRAAREAVIALTDEAGHLVTQALKPPHDFEFDKIFDPLLMFSKKRYAGRMYESNPDDFVYKYMGIALKRRDNAPIVKMIYGAAMKKVLDEQDVNGAADIVKKGSQDLVAGKYGMGSLTITKSLRADYADPTRIAHKALADRMTARDPGNAPASGDRIPYIYIMPEVGQQASKLQGDRIEAPVFIRENNLQPDYEHYIHHQLTNPISQMFAILLEQMKDFKKTLLPKEYSELDDTKKMTVRESIAADLLFRDALKRCSAMHKKAFISKHFGISAGAATQTVSSPRKESQQQQPAAENITAQVAAKQSSLLSFFSPRDLDAALIKTRKAVRTTQAKKDSAK